MILGTLRTVYDFKIILGKKMKYDLSCIGSALVDITFEIDESFAEKNNSRGIPKGAMTLIEKDDQNSIIEELVNLGKKSHRACGGSATNSIVAASLFGSNCYMSCIVNDDDNGRFYLDDLSSNGVDHVSDLYESDLPSGQCLVMVSEDAERTMCTNLGVNVNFSSENVDEEIIKNSDYLFIEGYLIASPGGYDSIKKAITVALKHKTKIALSLSDAFIVKSFEKELKELIKDKCNLIFCNEAEAKEFSHANNQTDIFDYFKNYTANLLITKGSQGCVGYSEDKIIIVPGFEVAAIDTNGAGDMFAGAVLSELIKLKSLEEAAKFGCFSASKIVQNSGPRLAKEEYAKIMESFSSY